MTNKLDELTAIAATLNAKGIEIEGLKFDCMTSSDFVVAKEAYGLIFYVSRHELECQVYNKSKNGLTTYVQLKEGHFTFLMIR